MCLFGRPIKDFIPIHPGRYKPQLTWQETLAAREEALRNRQIKAQERWSEHTKRLPPLAVSDHVRIQNQIGPHPTKWDKTGTVIDVRQFDQYVIRVDGSGRVTLRNRKFLRKCTPVIAPRPRHTINPDLFRPTPPRISLNSNNPPHVKPPVSNTVDVPGNDIVTDYPTTPPPATQQSYQTTPSPQASRGQSLSPVAHAPGSPGATMQSPPPVMTLDDPQLLKRSLVNNLQPTITGEYGHKDWGEGGGGEIEHFPRDTSPDDIHCIVLL